VTQVRAGNEAFAPQFPLWTDGQAKRRWISLPPGTRVDTSNPDKWEFPRGTRAWKEFTGPAGRNETRMIERLPNGEWRFVSYAWNAAGTEATLAPDDGIPARGIPSRADCLACHEGVATPLLGYSAVQLTPGLIEGPSPQMRAALGYLHGNCGHCHNAEALPALDLHLNQQASDPHGSAERTLASLVNRESKFRPHGAASSLQRVVAGNAAASLLVARMRSRDPLTRMPPLGVALVDEQGLATLERWIERDLP
jgi:hypothetical protein